MEGMTLDPMKKVLAFSIISSYDMTVNLKFKDCKQKCGNHNEQKEDDIEKESIFIAVHGHDCSYVCRMYRRQKSRTGRQGITAELVNVGTGFAADYENVDVKGKIVLAGIDQRNEAWIDGYLQEAALHGAAALVTYDVGGYAQASDEIRNIQDICTADIMPTVSCSKQEGMELIKAIEDGNNMCTLKVDNTVEPGKGTSYTVAGKIKGKSSEQQIMYAGHYDKYFYGFQDDCSSIGMIFTIAKAMKDSGYVPENDILIVCHGAEEWGAIGTQFDWATGSWGTINQAKPEWAKNMLALFNFELCGFKEADTETGFIQSVPEFDTFVELFVDSFGDLVDTGAFSKGITGETSHVQTMEDGINYRMAGVPYLVNGIDFEEETTFAGQKYHTEYDNKETWDESVMEMNARWFGGMGIVMDQSPALYLDGTAMASWLEETSDEELAKEAGVDVSAFQSKLENYHSYAQSLKKQAEDLNQKYADAYSGKDEKKMTELRKEGVDLNREILEFFEKSQDKMLGIEASSGVVTRQEGYINSLRLLKGALKACEEEVDWAEDEKSGALDQLWQLNGALAYDAILFSKENYEQTDSMYLDSARLFWGTGKVIELADINEATVAINENGDFDTAKPILEASYDRMLVKLKEAMETEMNGMEEITGE